MKTMDDIEDEVVLLDEAGTPIGRALKSAAHGPDTALHLAFSCHVVNALGEVLVTRRALTKQTWPGVWTNSLCGHPKPAESLTAAVRRRAEFELGIELNDIELELADVVYAGSHTGHPVASVLAMLEQKTAVYSFECPLTAGAVLAGADLESVQALARFGRLVGVAFQITDDILGVFGDPAMTGKSTTSDLRSGKLTVLTAHAATTDAWTVLSARLGDPGLDDDEADVLRAALLDCGALDEARRLADEHVALARFELDAAELPSALKTDLADLAQQAAERAR